MTGRPVGGVMRWLMKVASPTAGCSDMTRPVRAWDGYNGSTASSGGGPGLECDRSPNNGCCCIQASADKSSMQIEPLDILFVVCSKRNGGQLAVRNRVEGG